MDSKNFKLRVMEMVSTVPRGRVTTYRELARVLGSPRAARAVGRALNSNTDLAKIPCYRVVMSNGRIGGYRGGVSTKMKLLRAEGVKIEKGRVADFKNVIYFF